MILIDECCQVVRKMKNTFLRKYEVYESEYCMSKRFCLFLYHKTSWTYCTSDYIIKRKKLPFIRFQKNSPTKRSQNKPIKFIYKENIARIKRIKDIKYSHVLKKRILLFCFTNLFVSAETLSPIQPSIPLTIITTEPHPQ